MTLRALLFGCGGQVGRAVQALASPDHVLVAPHSSSVDVTDEQAVAAALREVRPDVVFNCAAFTRVDDAESQADTAEAVNAAAVGRMGVLARDFGARMIHLSTDYVFDGFGGAPYDVDADTNPLSVYGRTKRDGERLLLAALPGAIVVRTAWVHTGDATNFVTTVMGRLLRGQPMAVVDDQMGTPTRATHLARAMWLIAERPDLHGIFHFTDAGVASWFDVAVCVLDELRTLDRVPSDLQVTPTSTSAFPRPARRPRCAVLDKQASWARLGWVPPHWRSGVVATIREALDV